jgi:hypothetical protein
VSVLLARIRAVLTRVYGSYCDGWGNCRMSHEKRHGQNREIKTPVMLCKSPQRRIKWFGGAETRVKEVLVGVGVEVSRWR